MFYRVGETDDHYGIRAEVRALAQRLRERTALTKRSSSDVSGIYPPISLVSPSASFIHIYTTRYSSSRRRIVQRLGHVIARKLGRRLQILVTPFCEPTSRWSTIQELGPGGARGDSIATTAAILAGYRLRRSAHVAEATAERGAPYRRAGG
jgi:hypothetical protein